MKPKLFFVASVCTTLVSATMGLAADSGAAPPTKVPKKASSEWVFELLPKSMQKNPRLDLTVITEMTEAGKKLPPVTVQSPAYFELFSPGPKHLGHSQGNEVTPKLEEIERLLKRALATNGYLPAAPPSLPPSLLILYTWGSHSLLTEGDDENPVLSGNQVARNLLDRAALVGGEKFAKNLLDLFTQADAMSLASGARTAPGSEPVITPELAEFMNPVSMFKRASAKNEFLVDQAASNVYYVVASAYDHRSVTEKKRLLLWRTRMTVAAEGVSQVQSLPTLVLSAAPYFGREMTEPEILSKRALREGTVEIGTPTVVEPTPTPASPGAGPRK